MCLYILCWYLWIYLFWQLLLSELQSYAEKKTCVESAASQLLELSKKEDCDVVQNLVITVQDRYSKLQHHITERGKSLEDARKQVKQVG